MKSGLSMSGESVVEGPCRGTSCWRSAVKDVVGNFSDKLYISTVNRNSSDWWRQSSIVPRSSGQTTEGEDLERIEDGVKEKRSVTSLYKVRTLSLRTRVYGRKTTGVPNLISGIGSCLLPRYTPPRVPWSTPKPFSSDTSDGVVLGRFSNPLSWCREHERREWKFYFVGIFYPWLRTCWAGV